MSKQSAMYWQNSAGEVMLTTAGHACFNGAELFKLIDTMGLPLEFAVARIFDSGKAVDWVGYIEAARAAKWWDFQTYEKLVMLRTELVEYRDAMDAIIQRFKAYVVAVPHPAMST